MNAISQILFVISNGLMIPVILGLLFLIGKALILIVIFFKELSAHRYINKFLKEIIDQPHRAGEKKAMVKVIDSITMVCYENLKDHETDSAFCEYLLSQYQISVQKELNKSRCLVKFGPLLGLMGTLIPMGPALVGLAEGEIGTMAYNMQIAFATTVTGMAVAAIGMIKLQFDQRYYASTYTDLEFIFTRDYETESNTAK